MSEKRRTLDLKEVQAALDRAAWAGLHGTAEERSGRFRPRGDRSGEAKAIDADRAEPEATLGKK